MPDVIYTIGHSNRSADKFLALLKTHEIEAIADVRRFPGSRRWPHFGQQALATNLPEHGIEYHWFSALGGRRPAKNLSPENSAWEVAAFHAYADYTRAAEFQSALRALEALARRVRTAFMCAEALWTSCHRRLIADALTNRGWEVRHIKDGARTEVHRLPDFAQAHKDFVSYPGTASLFGTT